MKNEHALNAKISSVLTHKFHGKVEHIKVADKYQPGLSDFFLFGDAVAFLEVKFIKSMPARETSRLLTHGFSKEQLAFFGRMGRVYYDGYGVIGCDDGKVIYLVHCRHIPEEGNWTVEEFKNCEHVLRFDLSAKGIVELINHVMGS